MVIEDSLLLDNYCFLHLNIEDFRSRSIRLLSFGKFWVMCRALLLLVLCSALCFVPKTVQAIIGVVLIIGLLYLISACIYDSYICSYGCFYSMYSLLELRGRLLNATSIKFRLKGNKPYLVYQDDGECHSIFLECTGVDFEDGILDIRLYGYFDTVLKQYKVNIIVPSSMV